MLCVCEHEKDQHYTNHTIWKPDTDHCKGSTDCGCIKFASKKLTSMDYLRIFEEWGKNAVDHPECHMNVLGDAEPFRQGYLELIRLREKIKRED